MSYDAATETLKDTVRVFVTGQCDGLPDLREALGKHPEIELAGWAGNVMEGAFKSASMNRASVGKPEYAIRSTPM